MFSLESPHRGDSNEYTQHAIISIKKKVIPNIIMTAAKGFSLGTQERVRNSCGKRAIGVRAIEVILYPEIPGASATPFKYSSKGRTPVGPQWAKKQTSFKYVFHTKHIQANAQLFD